MNLRLKVLRTGSTWIRTPCELAHHLNIQTFLFITLFLGVGGWWEGHESSVPFYEMPTGQGNCSY